MTKKEMELLTYYQLRNHIGAMALKRNAESKYYEILYRALVYRKLSEVH